MQRLPTTSSKRLPWSVVHLSRLVSTPMTCILLLTIPAAVKAQPDSSTEHFVPFDQLESVFDTSGGILLPREEYSRLLSQAAEAERTTNQIPAPILVRNAKYSVRQAGNHAVVEIELNVEQFTSHWQQLTIPIGNLSIEDAKTDDQPAVIGRAGQDQVTLFHNEQRQFTVRLMCSTPLGRVGSDRAVGFDVIRNTAVELDVEAEAGQHLLLNGRRLRRPAPDEESTTYSVPAGRLDRTELRWTTQRTDSTSDTLVFVHSSVQADLSTDTLLWQSESRVGVFGGEITQLTATVPAALEITAVESTGLESWELIDDPERAGHTRIVMTWRQPFSEDRLIHLSGVATINGQQQDKLPVLEFNQVTAHTGRLLVRHEQQLRLLTKTGAGIRQLLTDGNTATTASPVFDFWLQDYNITVAVRPRDRELFSQGDSVLGITDTQASFRCTLSVETLNAPLFDLQLTLPDEWQLLSLADASGQPVPWRAGNSPTDVTLDLPQAIPPGGLLTLVMSLQRTLNDPAASQQLTLPVVTVPKASPVAGLYTISSAPDLLVSPTEIHGLVPAGEDSGNIVFESQGTPISGFLTIQRRPIRLSSRTEIRCWMDARETTTSMLTTIDVINGTTRTLPLRLPETLGDELRFDVMGIGPVPGYDSPLMKSLVPQQIQITETKSAEPVDGHRLWTLTFDRRFSGSVTLRTRSQLPRDGDTITAPVVEVPGAIHQEGLLAFEASPDQQFEAAADDSIRGLRSADPSLVTAPDTSTGRRIARVYQFANPNYDAVLAETRYTTQPVPTAVCRSITNVSQITHDGTTRRSCRVDLHCIGVQTLRFTLPESKPSLLWSTVLNSEAVEVRRDGSDYLVAIPTGLDQTDHTLEILFESKNTDDTGITVTEQESVRISIDAKMGQATPIDVLEQSWYVQYPNDALLLDHSDQFAPRGQLAQPGWLQSIASTTRWPSQSQTISRMLIAGFIVTVFVLLTLVAIRRHWKAVNVFIVAGVLVILISLALPVFQRAEEASRRSAGTSDLYPESTEDEELDELANSGVAMKGFGGGRGGIGGGGFGGGIPASGDDPFADNDAAISGKMSEGSRARLEIFGEPAPEESESLSIRGRTSLGIQVDVAQQEADEEVNQAEQLIEARAGRVAGRQESLKRGNARLSVRVNMEQPADYLSTEFHTVGSSPSTSRLSIVLRTASQLHFVRLLALAASLAVCWCLRRKPLRTRLTWIASLSLISLALVPFAPNQWQVALDGIFLGALSALILWPSARLVGRIQARNCCRPVAISSVLLIAMAVPAAADDANPPKAEPERTRPNPVVVPYDPDKPPLTADQVFVPQEQFLKLYRTIHPEELKSGTSRTEPIITAAFYKSTSRQQVEGNHWVQSFDGRFVIQTFADSPELVALPVSDIAIQSATVDEAGAIIVRHKDSYQIRLSQPGQHVVDVKFNVAASIDPSGGRVILHASSMPVGSVTFEIPDEELTVQVNRRSDTFRRSGTLITIPLNASEIKIDWQPETNRTTTDNIIHAATTSAMELDDKGILLASTVQIRCRQGSITESEITIPADYSVQSVDGDNIAGWSMDEDSTEPRLRVMYRTPVTSSATLQLTLFAREVITSGRQSINVPVPEPLGVSRNTGTICVQAGSELEVRTESLSGVSQLNPTEVALPKHANQDLVPGLAWRYSRHPAEVVVRVRRITDRLNVVALHGVQLESERQLWTSSLKATITGSPRRRIDILIPRSFLAFDVDCTNLADWYVTEPKDDAQDFRTLSVQLQTAQVGTVRIVIQGQNERTTDPTAERLAAPIIAAVDAAQTQLGVWLGAASEISNFSGEGWTSLNPAGLASTLKSLRPTPTDISLTSKSPQPSTVTLGINHRTASVICESVTVTNVTSTSIERTLALTWQISRSAADTFSVELPADDANTLDFQVTGLRQEQRTTLENGNVRITFHLQFPVSDRFFAAGAGAVPLPRSGQFNTIPVTFASNDEDQNQLAITSQSHFWMIVNQSGGVLAALDSDADTDDISVDQINTSLPAGFVKQAVAIRRISEDKPGSPWQIRFPESQQTSPAVIALAQHVTVLAADGSWRSRHTLQLRNESRQFLPIRLPSDSRVLFCLVKGQPTRVVRSDDADGALYLIPVPQSGEVNAPFEVQFAIAGTLPTEFESIRNQWQQKKLQIPVPTFPDFRDDKELGVTVARNTWSVYVPPTWSSTADEDPRQTNVIPATTYDFEDAVAMSAIDNSRSLLQQAGSVVESAKQYDLFNSLSSQLSDLKSQHGQSKRAREELAATQQQIERYLRDNRDVQSKSIELQQRSSEIQGNSILNNRALERNDFNSSNFGSIILNNGGNGVLPEISSGATPLFSMDPPANQDPKTFGFVITEEERLEIESKKTQESKSEDGSGASKAFPRGQLLGKDLRSNQSGRRQRALQESEPQTPARQNDGGMNNDGIIIRRFGDPNGAAVNVPSFINPNQLASPALADELSPEELDRDDLVPSTTARPVPTGLLSLKFDIPVDGERYDFVRTGGNAMLTLNVRGDQFQRWLLGCIWAVGCVLALVLIVRSLRSTDTTSQCSLITLIVAVAGISGWVLLPSGINNLALATGVVALTIYCGIRIAGTQRSDQQEVHLGTTTSM